MEGLSPAGVEPVVGHVLGLFLVGGIVVVIIIRVAVDLDLQCDVNVKYFLLIAVNIFPSKSHLHIRIHDLSVPLLGSDRARDVLT